MGIFATPHKWHLKPVGIIISWLRLVVWNLTCRMKVQKLDKVQLHSENENGISNEGETSGNSSHMAFGSCVSCQRGGNELACEIPILPLLEINHFH